ncbi:hypothetical protein O3Q51_04780 [Cryomorphaceae bacterium 1068]|nr:hypothetical protein [Cryomorphaceae bacterium 1068]
MNTTFPQYRKYPNNKSYFKVLSNESFEEIHVIGKKYFLTKVDAKILPDRHFIADMIAASASWVKIEESEYANVLLQVDL